MVIDLSEFAIVQAQNLEQEIHYLKMVVRGQIMRQRSDRGRSGLDSRHLAELARLHKLTLFLPDRADALPPGCESLAPWINLARLRTLQLNRQSLTVAQEVATVLTGAGIAHLHFKGPLQQLVLYGDLLRKPVGDADILVRRQDQHRAGALLTARGYVPTDATKQKWWSVFLGEVHFRKNGDGPMVDLHHRLQQPGLPSPYEPERFLERATDLDFEGHIYRVASAADRCLIAAISVTKALYAHEPCGASAVDLWAAWRLLSPQDRDGVVQLAGDHGLLSTLALAMRVAGGMFGADAQADFAMLQLPLVLDSVTATELGSIGWQPWLAQNQRIRRRNVLAALCREQPVRLVKEASKAIASEAYRRVLDATARRAQKEITP